MSQLYEVCVVERTPSATIPGNVDEKVIFGPKNVLAANESAAIFWAGSQKVIDGTDVPVDNPNGDPRYIEVMVRPFKK